MQLNQSRPILVAQDVTLGLLYQFFYSVTENSKSKSAGEAPPSAYILAGKMKLGESLNVPALNSQVRNYIRLRSLKLLSKIFTPEIKTLLSSL